MAEFEVIFVDVGEGDSTLIRLPDGKYALIDVFRCEDHGTVDLFRLLDDRLPDGSDGKKRLDYLIITHAHDDHIRGLGELYDRYEVGELWLPQHGYKEAPGDQYAEFERVEEAHPDEDTYWPKGSRSPYCYLGEEDEVTVRCFSPPGYIEVEEELDEDEARRLVHENCGVFKVSYNDVSVMLTGDSDIKCWRRVGGYYEDETDDDTPDVSVIDSTVLHASHHGSRSFFQESKGDETSLDALELIDPEAVVISVGAKNKHKHPHDDAMKAYREHVGDDNVLETQHAGTIVLEVEEDGGYQLLVDNGEFESDYGWDSDDDEDGGDNGDGDDPKGSVSKARPRSRARLDNSAAA